MCILLLEMNRSLKSRQHYTPKIKENTKMLQSLEKTKTKEIETRPLFKRKKDNYTRKQQRRKLLINYLRNEFAGSTTHGLSYVVNQNIHWCERYTRGTKSTQTVTKLHVWVNSTPAVLTSGWRVYLIIQNIIVWTGFWALSFCASIVFLIYLLAVQYERFIETPIVMSVEMDYFDWNVSYPAFTLCPMLRMDKEAFSAILNETNARTEKNLESYLWAIVSANLEYIELLDLEIPLDILSVIDPKEYTNIAARAFKKFNPDSITTNTNWPITVEEVMTELGMCHVVNSNIAAFDNPFKWANNAITYAKTNIELSVHDRDFFTQIIDYDDHYQVFIHNPDEIAVTTMSSYTHSLKGFMFFGVIVWNSKISDELRFASIRLRKCRLINEPISERFSIYSYNRCMLECRVNMIVKICGCIPHFYKPLKNERICNIVELKCLVEYKKEFITLSASQKLLNNFPNTKGIPRNSRECGCESLCDSVIYQKDYENYIPQHVNRLRIGISNFPKVRVVREIIFSGYEIILKIGGSINLCIGSSIISMVEFCVTFIKIPIYVIVQKIKAQLNLHWNVLS